MLYPAYLAKMVVLIAKYYIEPIISRPYYCILPTLSEWLFLTTEYYLNL